MAERIVLAFSGGLDTSVMVKWLQEKYNFEVITLTVDLGQGKELEIVERKSKALGAVETVIIDGKETFANCFVAPALQAGALYEGVYPLATALARPLIAKYLVDTAKTYNAKTIAHGCTGKGNDQVRFEVTAKILAPDLNIIAPVREWGMTRDEEVKYAQKHGIEVPQEKTLFSVDQNLWGRSIEAGALEDPWVEPPSEAYEWTNSYDKAPKDPYYLDITFQAGKPVAINDEEQELVSLISELNRIGGRYGVGRIDHVENRLVGIKTREIYEAPAAVLLHAAHNALETITLSKEQIRFKQFISKEYSEMVYNGLWFSALHQDLIAYLASNQRFVSGTIRIKLTAGGFCVVGRKSDFSLYNPALATYETGDMFDHKASIGFIQIFSHSVVNQAKAQLIDKLPINEKPVLLDKNAK